MGNTPSPKHDAGKLLITATYSETHQWFRTSYAALFFPRICIWMWSTIQISTYTSLDAHSPHQPVKALPVLHLCMHATGTVLTEEYWWNKNLTLLSNWCSRVVRRKHGYSISCRGDIIFKIKKHLLKPDYIFFFERIKCFSFIDNPCLISFFFWLFNIEKAKSWFL